MTLNSANITPLYSDSLTAILFVVFIITIVILVALVFWVVLYIKGSKRRALQQGEILAVDALPLVLRQSIGCKTGDKQYRQKNSRCRP